MLKCTENKAFDENAPLRKRVRSPPSRARILHKSLNKVILGHVIVTVALIDSNEILTRV